MPPLPQSVIKKMAELERVTAEIKGHVQAVSVAKAKRDEARWDKLRAYRHIGEGLVRAKELKPPGGFERYVRNNFPFTERQGEKYMAFAKAPPEALLVDEERRWAQISGTASKRRKKITDTDTGTRDDGSGTITLAFDAAVKADMDRMVPELWREWGKCSADDTFAEAIRRCHALLKRPGVSRG